MNESSDRAARLVPRRFLSSQTFRNDFKSFLKLPASTLAAVNDLLKDRFTLGNVPEVINDDEVEKLAAQTGSATEDIRVAAGLVVFLRLQAVSSGAKPEPLMEDLRSFAREISAADDLEAKAQLLTPLLSYSPLEHQQFLVNKAFSNDPHLIESRFSPVFKISGSTEKLAPGLLWNLSWHSGSGEGREATFALSIADAEGLAKDLGAALKMIKALQKKGQLEIHTVGSGGE